MSKLWLQDGGLVLNESGQAVLCDDCPCGLPTIQVCECTVPEQLIATIEYQTGSATDPCLSGSEEVTLDLVANVESGSVGATPTTCAPAVPGTRGGDGGEAWYEGELSCGDKFVLLIYNDFNVSDRCTATWTVCPASGSLKSGCHVDSDNFGLSGCICPGSESVDFTCDPLYIYFCSGNPIFNRGTQFNPSTYACCGDARPTTDQAGADYQITITEA